MTNIVSFDAFTSDHQIGLHQACLIRVVLEGRDDVELFERFWFSHLTETVEFAEAADVFRGAGCTGVAAAVEKSREVDGVPAIGIIDRDTLFREKRWPALYLTDDAAFAAETHAQHVFVTTRWEVEAYLLQPDLLADWVAGSHIPPPGPPALCARALNVTLAECSVLLTAAPFFAALHAAQEACPVGYFLGHSETQVAAHCATEIAAKLDDHKAVATSVEALIAAIRGQLPADEAERLINLLRFVDTKRLLVRLSNALNLSKGSHWVVANLMSRLGHRPLELERYLEAALAA